MSREHLLPESAVHHEWDRRVDPVLVIRPGDVVHLRAPGGGGPQVHPGARVDEIDPDGIRINLAGPVFVEGARPGDTLAIHVLELTTDPWGFTMVVPGLGLLPDDFAEPYLKIWDLSDPARGQLVPGVAVSLAPFLGTMGVHPGEPDRLSPLPPHRGGGNIDNRYLTVGSSLWLPVWCEGALFSCGDGHAAQGDGEICVSAIECGIAATLRFELHKTSVDAPRFVSSDRRVAPSGPFQGTMGISDDLLEGARIAARAMITWLVEERSLTREEAYVLCSVAADLRILEVVDGGVWNVGMTLPLSVFEGADPHA